MTNELYKLHLQQTRELAVRIQVLNQQNKILDQIEGDLIDGSINIDSQSAIRRSGDLQFVLKSKFFPTPSSPFWLNKRIKIYIGIRNIITDEFVWFNMGLFLIQNPTIDISIIDKTISIKCLDLMAYHTNEISGQIPTKVVIDIDTPIHTAIKSTIQILGKENNLLIDNSPYTVPYKIEKEIGSNVWDAIQELNNLYMGYECFYDMNGFFVFREIRNKINDPIIWDFNDKDFKTQITTEIQYDNIKNYIKVWGRLKDDGSQPSSELLVSDSNYPESLFTVEKLAEPNYRSLIINESKYFTIEQCEKRRDYEYFLHSNFAEKVNITCLPIYFLDVNQIINVNNYKYGVSDKYVIEKLSIPLKYDGLMNIQGYKLY